MSSRHQSLISVTDSGAVKNLVSWWIPYVNATLILSTRLTIHPIPASPYTNSKTLTADFSWHPFMSRQFFGNAVITNFASNFIWKIGMEGQHSIFSSGSVYKDHHTRLWAKRDCLHKQWKLFKVYDGDEMAQEIELNIQLTEIRASDIKTVGVVLLMSKHKLYCLDSEDGWNKAKVFDDFSIVGIGPKSHGDYSFIIYILMGAVSFTS